MPGAVQNVMRYILYLCFLLSNHLCISVKQSPCDKPGKSWNNTIFSLLPVPHVPCFEVHGLPSIHSLRVWFIDFKRSYSFISTGGSDRKIRPVCLMPHSVVIFQYNDRLVFTTITVVSTWSLIDLTAGLSRGSCLPCATHCRIGVSI